MVLHRSWVSTCCGWDTTSFAGMFDGGLEPVLLPGAPGKADGLTSTAVRLSITRVGREPSVNTTTARTRLGLLMITRGPTEMIWGGSPGSTKVVSSPGPTTGYELAPRERSGGAGQRVDLHQRRRGRTVIGDGIDGAVVDHW